MIIPLKSRFIQLSDDEFFLFCQEMRDFRIERAADGTILFMSPAGSESGRLNFEINIDLGNWNRATKLGVAFDSSTGFKLPNGAVRSPDCAWIEKSRWAALAAEDKEKFAPIVPDFVIEIRSKTDSLEVLKDKLLEYQQQGVRLGWLIDPVQQKVWIYKGNATIDQVENFQTALSGEDVLPGFELRVADFWSSES